jgi:sucrose-6F-phosphate phosphohydrolase
MPTIIATDLDGTLVGDDSALQKLNEMLQEPIQNDNLKLVYVTGRSPELFEELRQSKGLLEPAALITAVGTEIYVKGDRLPYWPKINYWDKEYIRSTLSSYKDLKEQQKSEQRDYKISYFYKGYQVVVDEIRNRLGSNYDVVYSGNLYLDVLPSGINKGTAIEFLFNFWQLPKTSVIACGDSENDISMLERYKAIIVGNATQELLKWYGNDENPEIYVAKDPYANGLIEGLSHFGVLE